MKFIAITLLLSFLVLDQTVAQISGDFWWLNKKFTDFSGVTASEVLFEELDDRVNDESDKIVFIDNGVSLTKSNTLDIDIKLNKSDETNSFEKLTFQLKYPDEINDEMVNKNSKVNKNSLRKNVSVESFLDNEKNKNENIMVSMSTGTENYTTENPVVQETVLDDVIVFPSCNIYKSRNESNQNSTKFKDTIAKSDIISFKDYRPIKTDENSLVVKIENECLCITNEMCLSNNGIINYENESYIKYIDCWKKRKVCCIFPISETLESSKTITNNNHEPKIKEKIKAGLIRFPRSTDDIEIRNRGQKQRESLLKRLFINVRTKPTSTLVTHKKIVNLDYDYVDPYSNIKNSKLKRPDKITQNPYQYDSVEFEEDYASELPTPGLLGSYSGQTSGNTPAQTWHDYNTRYATYNGFQVGNGNPYSNIDTSLDPRLDHKVSISKVKPEDFSNEGSEIITYQANPDFQVLQGFKLLNLIRNKNIALQDKNSKKTTTLKFSDYDSLESVSILPATRPSYGSSSEVLYDDVDDLRVQPFDTCGKSSSDYDSDNADDYNANPWLALVVRTKQHRTSLCSATLIHPRAAITAASCVHGAAPGEIVVRVGEGNLKRVRPQQRLASVFCHRLYKPGSIDNNLAILYWSRPIQVSSSVQPACIAEVKTGRSCNIVWSSLNQGRVLPRVQRATILKHRSCSDLILDAGAVDNLPSSAFCVTMHVPEYMSVIGAPLLCEQEGHVAMVGVAVARATNHKSTIILLPTHEWTKRVLIKLSIM